MAENLAVRHPGRYPWIPGRGGAALQCPLGVAVVSQDRRGDSNLDDHVGCQTQRLATRPAQLHGGSSSASREVEVRLPVLATGSVRRLEQPVISLGSVPCYRCSSAVIRAEQILSSCSVTAGESLDAAGRSRCCCRRRKYSAGRRPNSTKMSAGVPPPQCRHLSAKFTSSSPLNTTLPSESFARVGIRRFG